MFTCVVVDDEPDSSRLVEALLKRRQIVVKAAVSNPGSALAALEKYKPDFAIYDYLMPGMNGLQLAGLTRKLPGMENLPIFILTAQSYLENSPELLNSGCHFLLKPIKEAILEDTILNVLSFTHPLEK